VQQRHHHRDLRAVKASMSPERAVVLQRHLPAMIATMRLTFLARAAVLQLRPHDQQAVKASTSMSHAHAAAQRRHHSERAAVTAFSASSDSGAELRPRPRAQAVTAATAWTSSTTTTTKVTKLSLTRDFVHARRSLLLNARQTALEFSSGAARATLQLGLQTTALLASRQPMPTKSPSDRVA
jgi:hypothetical protein